MDIKLGRFFLVVSSDMIRNPYWQKTAIR
jgi:hypothetical protein